MEEAPLHEMYMRRALELAKLGRGAVSPNPLVGCVIVCDGKIIGEGWHQKYGEAHAEVNAVNNVEDKSLLRESTVYVTLEPCAHFGKTPPCADMLVQQKVKRVVIASSDPNPLVAGKGIAKLKEGGVEVVVGILQHDADWLNRRFFKFIERKKSYIILKWAQTADGFIARKTFDSKWISDEYSRQLVHRWRTEEDAILVGTQTAFYDNPRLNVREWTGRDPVRVVLDRNRKLPDDLELFNGTQLTLCYNHHANRKENNVELVQVSQEDFLSGVLKDLYQRKIQSVIVEGGAKTLQAFIDANEWDEARIFISPQKFGSGISAPIINNKTCHDFQLKQDVLRICTAKGIPVSHID